jgi:hypothetical protein
LPEYKTGEYSIARTCDELASAIVKRRAGFYIHDTVVSSEKITLQDSIEAWYRRIPDADDSYKHVINSSYENGEYNYTISGHTKFFNGDHDDDLICNFSFNQIGGFSFDSAIYKGVPYSDVGLSIALKVISDKPKFISGFSNVPFKDKIGYLLTFSFL